MTGLVLAVALFASRGARAESTDDLELTARTHFAASEYQAALDIYARLYARTLHPTYLRNIGRCYQNLGQPDKAISAFREYLRKAKTVTADERTEVEGFIREMEALERSQEEKAKAPAAAPAPAAPAPNLSAPPPAPTGPAAVVTSPQSRPADEAAESSPFYARWWFWTLVAVAVGGAATAVALSTGGSPPSASTNFGTMPATPSK